MHDLVLMSNCLYVCSCQRLITVSQLFFAAIYFHVFVFMDILTAICFLDCRNGPCKSNVQYAYMEIFEVIYLWDENRSLAKTVGLHYIRT